MVKLGYKNIKLSGIQCLTLFIPYLLYFPISNICIVSYFTAVFSISATSNEKSHWTDSSYYFHCLHKQTFHLTAVSADISQFINLQFSFKMQQTLALMSKHGHKHTFLTVSVHSWPYRWGQCRSFIASLPYTEVKLFRTKDKFNSGQMLIIRNLAFPVL